MTGKVSRQFLYQYLKGRVYKGHLGVPLDKDVEIPDALKNHTMGGSRTEYMTGTDATKAREFMRVNFYTSAPVPVAMRLPELCPGIIEQELDLMSHTIAYKDTETDEILGYNRGNIWITRPEYNSFEVDGSMWMEVGTDIAHEMASSSEEVLSIWRDYQYQLYYHLSQTLAKKWKKEFILYPGIGFISEKHRKRPTNTLAIGQYMAVSAMPKHFCATHGITVHKQRKVLLEMVDGKFLQELAYIPYKDILLKLNGKLVFGDRKGGISIFGNVPHGS